MKPRRYRTQWGRRGSKRQRENKEKYKGVGAIGNMKAVKKGEGGGCKWERRREIERQRHRQIQ